MPVRLRITFLFSLLAFVILSVVCGSIYYFSYQQRLTNIKSRLTNRAITTARLLSQREIFDEKLINLIDSSTTISLKRKTAQAYDSRNRNLYEYSDVPNDTLSVDQEILNLAREYGSYYFKSDKIEAIAYYYTHNNSRIVMVIAAEDAEAKENLSNLLKILILSFLVGNIFILVGGYLFSGRLLRPIKKISEDVAEISAQNLTRRIQTGKTRDEWYQLSHTVNDLLNRLQESFELQRRFISNASHELSTPLTSISSQLEITLQRKRSSEEYAGVMQSGYQDVRHMNKLTQTLLEFAKASGNPGGLEIDLIRLDEILLRLPSEVAKTDPSFSVLIQFDQLPEEEEKLLVFGNEALLLTAIKNIVVNACKYSFDHRAVVNLGAGEGCLVITIENTGAGIPRQELSNIFQPFYRMKENRNVRGFGLGLPLTKRIIKLHKGFIEVSSEPGQLTRFTIQLPAAQSLRSSKL